MANEFNIKNGFITSGNSNVYANLNVTGGLTATTVYATTYQNLPFSGNVTGTGSINVIPKWDSSNSIADSTIVDDGSMVTIPNITISNDGYWGVGLIPLNDADEVYNPLYVTRSSNQINQNQDEGKVITTVTFDGVTPFFFGGGGISLTRKTGIEVLYSIVTDSTSSIRTGTIVSAFDPISETINQTEYSPPYINSGETINAPSLVFSGGTLNFYCTGTPSATAVVKLKYTLI